MSTVPRPAPVIQAIGAPVNGSLPPPPWESSVSVLAAAVRAHQPPYTPCSLPVTADPGEALNSDMGGYSGHQARSGRL